MVQLAASRSRALARGVYSELQGNYNDLLGQRNPLILRVDLGDKGIFYRVNVPGFESRNAASAFCQSEKSRTRLFGAQATVNVETSPTIFGLQGLTLSDEKRFFHDVLRRGALSSLPAILKAATSCAH